VPGSTSIMPGSAPITVTLKNADISIGKIVLRRKRGE